MSSKKSIIGDPVCLYAASFPSEDEYIKPTITVSTESNDNLFVPLNNILQSCIDVLIKDWKMAMTEADTIERTIRLLCRKGKLPIPEELEILNDE